MRLFEKSGRIFFKVIFSDFLLRQFFSFINVFCISFFVHKSFVNTYAQNIHKMGNFLIFLSKLFENQFNCSGKFKRREYNGTYYI